MLFHQHPPPAAAAAAAAAAELRFIFTSSASWNRY